jgi:hypothetical protein
MGPDPCLSNVASQDSRNVFVVLSVPLSNKVLLDALKN